MVHGRGFVHLGFLQLTQHSLKRPHLAGWSVWVIPSYIMWSGLEWSTPRKCVFRGWNHEQLDLRGDLTVQGICIRLRENSVSWIMASRIRLSWA